MKMSGPLIKLIGAIGDDFNDSMSGPLIKLIYLILLRHIFLVLVYQAWFIKIIKINLICGSDI